MHGNLYFPPSENGKWEFADLSPKWDTARLDEIINYVGQHHTRQFLILSYGRIVKEAYWDSTPESTYDVFSLQKSLVSILVGIAQEKGLIDIHNPVSAYLGAGWTQVSPDEEIQITIRHLLSMNSGLDETLKRETDPESVWFYNTPAYHYLKKVIASAACSDLQEAAEKWLTRPINMSDTTWVPRENWVFPDGTPIVALQTNARDLGRFGLLMLANGRWKNEAVIKDQSYLSAALKSSQQLNPAYGYLWWLNGKKAFQTAISRTISPGAYFPTAPADLIAGLGFNDQKLFLVPSQELVIVRLGRPTENSEFQDRLWSLLTDAC
ncbi:MAG: serine hydrolase [Deltaproteobacteria bacterium]|nr:serine hydrolase [Deltaproteobacteria bacterium]MBT4264500.1 serine hydrolase [Deltaproteobacteria bacterium]MBT4637751.1 serine hydrolase [Deltaproteobacteria bacterium]MBT6614841.1 serine hydrolase [Deltaproteobacteria bacterium]MBT7153802.1 serine hydrolase [Deltaproteobacteria bacterium]